MLVLYEYLASFGRLGSTNWCIRCWRGKLSRTEMESLSLFYGALFRMAWFWLVTYRNRNTFEVLVAVRPQISDNCIWVWMKLHVNVIELKQDSDKIDFVLYLTGNIWCSQNMDIDWQLSKIDKKNFTFFLRIYKKKLK